MLTNARLQSYDAGNVSKCNKHKCKLCNIIITGNSFVIHPTKFNFIIKCNVSCDTLNCIYGIKCQGCQKMYIGDTSNLRLRTNLHRDHAARNIGLKIGIYMSVLTINIKINF